MSNERAGNFSSSSIWKLMTNGKAKGSVGKPFQTYVKQKVYEARIGRQLENEAYSHATSWGNLVEQVAFAQLSNVKNGNLLERFKHPFHRWSGQPDYLSAEIVGDIKCPFTLLSFCELYEINSGEELKEQKPEYYWQLISNAILTNKKVCELTIFCPLEEQIELIRQLAEQEKEAQWVFYANHNQLPFLAKTDYYKPIKQIKFTPTEEDINALIERVKKAEEYALEFATIEKLGLKVKEIANL